MDETQRTDEGTGQAAARPDSQVTSQSAPSSPEPPNVGADLDLPPRTDAEPETPTAAAVPPSTVPEVAEPVPGSDASSDGARGAEDDWNRRARDVAEQLKPVAVAAEEIASKAIELSTKGLTRLNEILDRRRQERAAQGDQPPPQDND